MKKLFKVCYWVMVVLVLAKIVGQFWISYPDEVTRIIGILMLIDISVGSYAYFRSKNEDDSKK